jgi:AcrR family transcriptional regulator
MAIVVEHEKRRREILERALDVFVEEGFENATYQKIADRSGITRTTLYIYFHNKREIFNFSIKQLLSEFETDLNRVRKEDLPYPEKLKKTISFILKTLEINRRLLSVILDYLFYLARQESAKQLAGVPAKPRRDKASAEAPGTIDTRVRRRTIRLRHILSSMVIDGIKAGELKKLDVKTINDLLYGLIETAIFHMAVLKRPSAGDLREAVNLLVDQIAEQKER